MTILFFLKPHPKLGRYLVEEDGEPLIKKPKRKTKKKKQPIQMPYEDERQRREKLYREWIAKQRVKRRKAFRFLYSIMAMEEDD